MHGLSYHRLTHEKRHSAPGRLSYPAVMMFRPVEKCDQSAVSTMAASIESAAACVTKNVLAGARRQDGRNRGMNAACTTIGRAGGACGPNCRRARSARKASSDIGEHISVTGPLPSKATLREGAHVLCYRLFFFENRSPYPPILSFSINSIPACSKAACILTNVEA
jgi:hypothetical protein